MDYLYHASDVDIEPVVTEERQGKRWPAPLTAAQAEATCDARLLRRHTDTTVASL
jgi:hypothetical protein